MTRMDKTVKLLLALIALFLGVIALQPILRITPDARAQTGTSTQTDTATPAAPGPAAINVSMVTRIIFRDKVQGVAPLDSQGVFLVWTSNNVEVWRVDGTRVN